jgi:hypothetical protein
MLILVKFKLLKSELTRSLDFRLTGLAGIEEGGGSSIRDQILYIYNCGFTHYGFLRIIKEFTTQELRLINC